MMIDARWRRLALAVVAAGLWSVCESAVAVPTDSGPVFVGGGHTAALTPDRTRSAAATYMTAMEMQSRVAGLTGFSHPAFASYADVLGKYDPLTGRRTADRPSLVAVLFMQQIAESVASNVVEREEFLDDSERYVFNGVDLAASPSSEALRAFVAGLHTSWLGQAPGATTLRILTDNFRGVENTKGPAAAYGQVLSLLLQHGGLYFY